MRRAGAGCGWRWTANASSATSTCAPGPKPQRGIACCWVWDTAIAWAAGLGHVDWVDLEVLSANAPARALYRKRGFVQTGEIPDLLRIDGEAHGYCHMSLSLPAHNS